MFNIGGGEMVLLAVLALLVFGPEGLPEIMRTVARTVRAFRQAATDFQSEVNTALTLENQKQDVTRRRRSRPLAEPAPPVAEIPEEEDAEDASPEADLADGDQPEAPSPRRARRARKMTKELSPDQAASEPPEEKGAETARAETEPRRLSGDADLPSTTTPDDEDDGPGKPMSRQRHAPLSVNGSSSPSSSEPESTAPDLESVS